LGRYLVVEDAVDLLGEVADLFDVVHAVEEGGDFLDDRLGVGALVHGHQVAGDFTLEVVDGTFDAGYADLLFVILVSESFIGNEEAEAHEAQHFAHFFDGLVDGELRIVYQMVVQVFGFAQGDQVLGVFGNHAFRQFGEEPGERQHPESVQDVEEGMGVGDMAAHVFSQINVSGSDGVDENLVNSLIGERGDDDRSDDVEQSVDQGHPFGGVVRPQAGQPGGDRGADVVAVNQIHGALKGDEAVGGQNHHDTHGSGGTLDDHGEERSGQNGQQRVIRRPGQNLPGKRRILQDRDGC